MKKITIIITGLIIVFFSFSCKKKIKEEFNPDRFFAPGRISVAAGETEAKLEWGASLYSEGKAPEYTVEVSTDSLFQSTAAFSTVIDLTSLTLTDNDLQIKQKYFARVKTNARDAIADSKWEYSPSFLITGEQIFFPITDIALKDKSVLLTWRITPGLTKIVITPDGAPAVEHTIASDESDAGEKLITGLTPETNYTAEIFQNALSKGIITFTTKELSLYTVVLSPGDDLATAVTNAADGDVIGLNAGVYDVSSAAVTVLKKTISIVSVSGDPTDTKVLFREFSLRGTGAGITLSGLEFDANKVAGTYLINLLGESASGDAATFTSITIKNSIVRHIGRAMIRGSQAGNRVHKIDFIKVEGCLIVDCDGDYALMEIQKLEFNRIDILRSTFNRISNNLIRYDTNIGSPAPEVLFDQVTVNAFGNNGRRALFDFNTPANIVVRNSIIANSRDTSAMYPTPAISADLFRAGNGATIMFENSRKFNLLNTAGTADLNTPGVTIQEVTLPWMHTSIDLSLPAGSPLLTASTSGGPIGDPRWAN